MRLSLGKMRMSSSEFWGMSLSEFLLAVDGFVEFNSGGEPTPMNRDELNDLMERFPD
jgi:uncharacterized phage protein (TIGR02216 family)